MKKHLLFFIALFAFYSVQLNAQSPGCLAAKALPTYFSPSPLVFDTTVKIKSTETWFKIPVPADSVEFRIMSTYTGYRKLADKIELYSGLSCGSLTFLKKDSLTAANDSVLVINTGGLNAGDTLYIRTTFIANVSCPLCPDSALFRAQLLPFETQLVPCTTCNTFTGCNLVCNGNFEAYGNPLNSITAYSISNACGWSNLTQGSCDYFTTLAPGGHDSDVPCNPLGYETPHGGNGYGGFASHPSATYVNNPAPYAEFMKTKLLGVLSPTATYTVSFWLSQSDQNRIVGNTVGVYFFDDPNNLPSALTSTTSTVSPTSPLLNPFPVYTVSTQSLSKTGWTQFTFTFTPSASNLQYMAIGAFTTAWTNMNCSGNTSGCSHPCQWFSYYFIDDISVTGEINIAHHTYDGCNGRSQSLTTTLPPPITWSGLSTPITGQTISTHNPGTYTATATVNGCLMNETFTIYNNLAPQGLISISPYPAYICPPTNTITLTASGGWPGQTYTWHHMVQPWGTTGLYQTSPVVGSGSSFTYTVGTNPYGEQIGIYGHAANGCYHGGTIPITVAPIPTITVNSPTVCAGSTATLTATSSVPGTSFSWSGGLTGNPTTFTPSSTGTYTVTGTTPATCTATATSTVTVYATPSISSAFSLTPTVTCINTTVTADAQQTPAPLTYYNFTYDFGDPGSPGNVVSNTNGAATTHNYASAGIYTVTLSATATSINGCSKTSVTTQTVQVHSIPTDIDISGLQQTTCEAPSSMVTTNIPYNPAYTYSWAVTAGTGVTITPGAQANTATVTMVNPNANVTICLTVSVANCSVTMCKSIMYCCPGGAGITVLTNPTVNAPLAAGNYVVNGTMTVATASATWTGVNLTMNPFSQIVFSGTNTLNINSSHIHGCKSMWEGIKINNQVVTLNTNATLIEDAQKAVYIKQKGTLNASSTWFNKNRIGVELDQAQNVSSFTSSCFISTATPSLATVAAPLPAAAYPPAYSAPLPYLTSSSLTTGQPERGLNILASLPNRVNFVNRNLFEYVFNGIYVQLTTQNIYYADFQRCASTGGPPAESACIKVVGEGSVAIPPPLPVQKIVNIGDRNDPSKKCNFNASMNGVWWRHSTVGDIATNTFTAIANDAIHIEDHEAYATIPASHLTEQVSVLGNKISNAKNHGVFVYDYTRNRVRIAQNQFVSLSATYRPATAIEAEALVSSPASANMLWINDNNGVNAYGHTFSGTGIEGMYNGIRVVNYQQAHVTGNKVNTYPATAPGTTGGAFAAAVTMTNNTGTEISNNTLRNTTSSAGYSWWLYGVLGESSPNSKIFCNDIAEIGVPLQLKGQMPSDVYGNTISNGLTGLWLAINGFIGDQDHPAYGPGVMPQDNQWGTFVNGAFLSGQTLDTYCSGDGAGNLPSTGTNIFYRSGNTAVWQPQNNDIQVGSIAFTPMLLNNILIQPPTCSAPEMEDGGDEQGRMMQSAPAIINEEINFGDNAENANYIIKQELYKNLRPLNELRENNAELAGFYSEHAGANYDKLYMVDSLISGNDSANAAMAQSINNTVAQSSVIEQNQVSLNQLIINRELNGVFSETDYANARVIAALCPFTHGKAVYQARAMLSAVDTVRYMNECEVPGMDFIPGAARLLSKSVEENRITPLLGLYPNPATTLVTLVMSENEDAITVEIVNLLGQKQEVKGNKTGPGIVQLNTSSLENGTYLCNVYVNGILQQNEKLVIVK